MSFGRQKTSFKSTKRTALHCAALFCILFFTACRNLYPSLPKNRIEEDHLASIQLADESPVYSWHGTYLLTTYWGEQEVTGDVSAYISDVENSKWRLSVKNREGVAVPFLGIRKTFTGDDAERAVIVPEFSIDKLKDGLYCAVDPGIETLDGVITAIRPDLIIFEIRNHAFKPFKVELPLIPDTPSQLLPLPPHFPETLQGTPFPN